VLFADDVKGSMELAEQLDPEALSQIMQRFFRILSDGPSAEGSRPSETSTLRRAPEDGSGVRVGPQAGVERFEGFVAEFTGDGVMALFGAPIAHEDHAQRACLAALHLRDELGAHLALVHTQVRRADAAALARTEQAERLVKDMSP